MLDEIISLHLVSARKEFSWVCKFVDGGVGPLVRYVKLWVAHAPGMPGIFSLSLAPRVSDPDMHHDTCMTHVPWCMPGSQTSGFFLIDGRVNVLSILGASALRNFTYLVRGPWWWICSVICVRNYTTSPHRRYGALILFGHTIYQYMSNILSSAEIR